MNRLCRTRHSSRSEVSRPGKFLLVLENAEAVAAGTNKVLLESCIIPQKLIDD